MKEFDVNAFLEMCTKTASSFQKNELKKYPQNEFILKSSRQINIEFQKVLDDAKLEVGLAADEIYVTKWSDGTSTANLGLVLLSRKVIFSEKFDLKKLQEEARNKKQPFLFELEFSKRYQSCLRLFEKMEQEISGAWNARVIPKDEVLRVLSTLEDEYKVRFTLLLMLSKKKYTTNEKYEIQRNLNHLDVLISKLKRIHKGHY